MALNVNKKEALQWAENCLGETNKEAIPSQFKHKSRKIDNEGIWVSVKPTSTPNLKEIRPYPYSNILRKKLATLTKQSRENLSIIFTA